MDKRSIGVFDSGVGGLTVVKELIKLMPEEDIVYFGDTARVPYGTKSHHTIIKFSIENVLFLLRQNVKLIVVACNTSSSVALPALKRNFKVPVIGVIKPGAADAVLLSKNKKIGVIGTAATIKSQAYEKEITKGMPGAKVFSKSCPLFVPLVEEGWLGKKVTLQIIKEYLLPFKSKGIDVLILGCTHYPLLKASIRNIIGDNVRLVDSAVSTADAVNRLLVAQGIVNESSRKGRYRFFVSDEPERFRRTGERFLGRRLSCVRRMGYAL